MGNTVLWWTGSSVTVHVSAAVVASKNYTLSITSVPTP